MIDYLSVLPSSQITLEKLVNGLRSVIWRDGEKASLRYEKEG